MSSVSFLPSVRPPVARIALTTRNTASRRHLRTLGEVQQRERKMQINWWLQKGGIAGHLGISAYLRRRGCSTGPWRSSAPCACCHPTRFFRRGARSVRRSERRPPCVYQGAKNCVMSSGVSLRCRVRAQPRLHLHTIGLNRLYVRACKNV